MTEAEFNTTMTPSGRIDPHRVGTPQGGVSSTIRLRLGNADASVRMKLEEYGAALKSGRLKPENIEPIELYVLDGKIVSSDHRRLVAARLAGVEVNDRIASPQSWVRALRRKVDPKHPLHEIDILPNRRERRR